MKKVNLMFMYIGGFVILCILITIAYMVIWNPSVDTLYREIIALAICIVGHTVTDRK